MRLLRRGGATSRFETLDRVQPHTGRVTERLAVGNAQLRAGVGIGRTLPHIRGTSHSHRLWNEGAAYGGASGGYEMGVRDQKRPSKPAAV